MFSWKAVITETRHRNLTHLIVISPESHSIQNSVCTTPVIERFPSWVACCCPEVSQGKPKWRPETDQSLKQVQKGKNCMLISDRLPAERMKTQCPGIPESTRPLFRVSACQKACTYLRPERTSDPDSGSELKSQEVSKAEVIMSTHVSLVMTKHLRLHYLRQEPRNQHTDMLGHWKLANWKNLCRNTDGNNAMQVGMTHAWCLEFQARNLDCIYHIYMRKAAKD